MELKEYIESEYLTIQMVKDSNTKKAVLLSGGTLEPSRDGSYKVLQVFVEMDGKKKLWKMNKTTAKNLVKAWGTETQVWVGRAVNLAIMPSNKGESIIGTASA